MEDVIYTVYTRFCLWKTNRAARAAQTCVLVCDSSARLAFGFIFTHPRVLVSYCTVK